MPFTPGVFPLPHDTTVATLLINLVTRRRDSCPIFECHGAPEALQALTPDGI
jgi:hypothetical protein